MWMDPFRGGVQDLCAFIGTISKLMQYHFDSVGEEGSDDLKQELNEVKQTPDNVVSEV